MELRDKSNYGVFTANSNVGKIRFRFDISGFGEEIEVYHNGKMIFYCESLYEEDSEIINGDKIIEATSIDYGYIEIYKDTMRRSKNH